MNYSPLSASLPFPFRPSWEQEHTSAMKLAGIQQWGETDRETGRRADRQCVRAVSVIHSSVVPYHCFSNVECPQSGSPPLLSPPGCPSVHRGGGDWRGVCVALLRRPQPDDLQNNCRSIPHTLNTILFSKLLILLLCDPLTSFPFHKA